MTLSIVILSIMTLHNDTLEMTPSISALFIKAVNITALLKALSITQHNG
jgi:hypothetical protein